MSDRWLTVTEAAERVGRTERTIRAWIAHGDVTAILRRVRETELVRTDQLKRKRRAQGRPRRSGDK